MLIRVIYQNFQYDFVKPWVLDELIEAGKVAMFRRRGGWVIVGIDPVRTKKFLLDQFSERRQRRE